MLYYIGIQFIIHRRTMVASAKTITAQHTNVQLHIYIIDIIILSSFVYHAHNVITLYTIYNNIAVRSMYCNVYIV